MIFFLVGRQILKYINTITGKFILKIILFTSIAPLSSDPTSVTEVFVEEPLALPGSAKNLRILSAQSSSKILIVARSVICLVGPPT